MAQYLLPIKARLLRHNLPQLDDIGLDEIGFLVLLFRLIIVANVLDSLL